MSLTRIGLILIPISTATACGFSIGKKIFYDVIINKYDKYRGQFEKDQHTMKSYNLDKFYRKSLQDNVIDKKNMNLYVLFLLNIWKAQKMNLLYKYEYKDKIKLFQSY